ncbi:uncharacterized protein LAESUDRAFT_744514 [Laetiporus sulphureus 93-53]|uniref:Methyltransferase domain-containing protein n=1 Tax=Laetiporus sulphureus 93-53 TaxID=1314785 RepID=A0A165CX78_9APHY|nr:uncharacterized protein LAESUDRAFT_744514 [Laetiporus sulphureus 93-53]KZT03642.1 hypothetical protein LAESUDRAFT_744514 [Laetiporus sulphureus 93-53]
MSKVLPTIDSPSSTAAIYPHAPNQFHIVLGQIEERVQLPGENILEIGCGQGDCTVALAAAIGEAGHVTAVDPASLDYGSPYTLGQGQKHIRASTLGPRISFVQADPLDFLARTTDTYITAILAHCIWYFSSADTLRDILSALIPHTRRICIAEYALRATDPRAMPHVLAALTLASLECRKLTSTSNIRTVLSPAAITMAASSAGLVLVREDIIVPSEGMLDGRWEVGTVLSEDFEREVVESVQDSRERALVMAMRDSVQAAKEILKEKGEQVRTMDVWVAAFETRT